ncbi:GMC oxidoreductase-like protein [Thozetella sp. PMI_491]|nr:GMC oxidoreductase-like protein [Thozetella sp. PMI_491]
MYNPLAGVLGIAVVVAAQSASPVITLRDEYDFIIAGGGTAGLTVADRLSAAFPNRTVLVVEWGDVQFAPGSFEPPTSPPPVDQWNFTSLPLTALGNSTASVQVGRVVGGSSAHNGQFFDRASRQDFAAWDALVNGGKPSKVKWDWDSIFPFYKKSAMLAEPSSQVVADLGYTYDPAAYGSGPIVASFPPFQWPSQRVVLKAYLELGVALRGKCDTGDKTGLCWVTTSQYPYTAERSYAGIGHYLDVIGSRKNYDLLVKHRVRRVIYDKTAARGAPPKVEIVSLANGTVREVKAKLEVILSAGALHTPTILQRSGIGGAGFLKKAGIELVADLPGVGYNFQDHGGPIFKLNVTNPLMPNANTLKTNATYLEQSEALYAQRPAEGPYTLALFNNVVYLSLPNITSESDALVRSIKAQVKSGSFASQLPPEAAPEVVAGYRRQLEVLASLYADPSAPVIEMPIISITSVGAHLHPLSRGTVMLNISDPEGEPILDYRTATNQIDVDIMVSYIPFYRRLFNAQAIKSWGVIELKPGPTLTSKQDLEGWLRQPGSVQASFQHPCGTAAMLPRELGGVVDAELRVHGLDGLRVIDASIFPLVPATHTSATVYAVAEKAADLIIERWKT